MKNFFLTLDFEEWYHLEYLKNKKNDFHTINELGNFFDLLKKHEIKITVFVLGELVQRYKSLIKKISDQGHEIAIHGWNHDLVNRKSQSIFLKEILKTKKTLEEIIGKEVIGYRSPCFSIDNKKLESLRTIGIKYDSSFIRFSDHPLYGRLNMEAFRQIEDLVYVKKDFFELELPTMSLFGKNIPISGGGYFRLFPKFILKYLFKKFIKNNNNFIMYLHPFELTNLAVKTNYGSMLNKFRFSVGRKNNLKKVDWMISFFKSFKFEFKTISEYLRYAAHKY